MKTARSLIHHLHNLFRQAELDRDLSDELAAHLEMHIADNLRAGMSPEEARRAALMKLGGMEQTKESIRAGAAFRFWKVFSTTSVSPSGCWQKILDSLR